MIPANAFTAHPIVSDFVTPLNEPYTPLTQKVYGGIALNDPAKGRLYQYWIASCSNGVISVAPENNAVVFSLDTNSLSGAPFAISLAFDNNMSVVLAWSTVMGSYLYYFDTLTSGYITREFLGHNSCRVCVDDANDYYSQLSDVIFAYTQNGNLYWRQQRDRYDVERLIGPATGRLIKVGKNRGNRLQFELN